MGKVSDDVPVESREDSECGSVGEEEMPLAGGVGTLSANLRIQRAIAFIAATPFTHVQEGR